MPRMIRTSLFVLVPMTFFCTWFFWTSQDRVESSPQKVAEGAHIPTEEEITRLGRIVEAQAFVLRSKDGRLRGLFSTNTKEEAGLQLFGRQGHPLAEVLITENDEPRIVVQSKDLKTHITITIFNSDNAFVSLEHDAKNDKREAMVLHASEDDLGLSISKNDTKALSLLSLGSRGTLDIMDSNGKSLIELYVNRTNNSILKLANPGKNDEAGK
jgi:hypothetical protein